MFRRNKQNKAKLEHKLYLARESPEPIFDLAECDLKSVPHGIYSLCRVFLKEVLRLEHNSLSSLSGGGSLQDLSLIKVLDLHDNNFTHLPDDISLLKNLSELYLSNNELKKLPESICTMKNLEILDMSNNKLKVLPQNMGDLFNLIKLDLRNNHLNCLPKSMCRNQKLKQLQVDFENFVYPPANVVQKSAEFIIKYICDDVGFTYSPLDFSKETVDSPKEKNNEIYEDLSFQDKIRKLENKKKQKMEEFLEIERNNELLQRQEIELASIMKANREKLLADITEQQTKIDFEVAKIQQEKDSERFRFIEQLQEAELNADLAIKNMLSLNDEPMVQLLEQEKQEEEKLLLACRKHSETLRKNDILIDMQNFLAQETEKFKKYDENRSDIARSLLQQEMQSDSRLLNILYDQDVQKKELLSALQKDIELQKAIVGSLLERADSRSWGLAQQVKLVENQLAALTVMEMNRRKLDVDKHLNDLSEKRTALSGLLINLLEQQAERRRQLLCTLKTIEKENNDHTEDFWLKQYQKLLEWLPDGLSETQKDMNPALVEALLMSGVIHCVPFLAKLTQNNCDISNIGDEDLKQAGIISSSDRTKILDAFQIFNKQKLQSEIEPTAPLLTEEASAPPLESTNFNNECIVCMDLHCQVIFVPCGHLCCCSTCSNSIDDCPMCRGNIERKIRVIAS